MRKLSVLLALAAILAAGCPKKNQQRTTPEPVTQPDAAPAATTTAEPDPKCVEDCVARNQAKAVGAEQIEADCKAECSQPKPEEGGTAPPAE